MSYLLALGHCGGQPAMVEPVGAQDGHLRGIRVESMQKLWVNMFHMVVLSDKLVSNLRDPSLRQPARLRKGSETDQQHIQAKDLRPTRNHSTP